ncbi:hypothetical protein ACHAXS_012973 [Conticribra weissflogii]
MMLTHTKYYGQLTNKPKKHEFQEDICSFRNRNFHLHGVSLSCVAGWFYSLQLGFIFFMSLFSIVVVDCFLLQVDADSSYELVRLSPDDASNGDGFGWAVSMSTDGNFVLVGAPSESNDEGAAYIFKWNEIAGSGWVQQSKLVRDASDAATGNFFGRAVAIDDDVALVGFPFWSTKRGKVYVYRRESSGGADSWVQDTTLTGAGTSYEHFGYSLDISGNYAVIGAIGYSSARGSAYIYNFSDKSSKIILASDGDSGDRFGWAVSICDNVAIVGSPGTQYPSGYSGAGAAYIFRSNNGDWIEEQKVEASDRNSNDTFGRAVAVRGDYVIVGAPHHDTDGNYDSGAAYLFLSVSNVDGERAWTQIQKLSADDGADNDYFGWSVDFFGNNAIVGAYSNDAVNPDSGASYVFQQEINGCVCSVLLQEAKLSPTDLNSNSYFGSSVATNKISFIVGGYGNAGIAYTYIGVDSSSAPSSSPSLKPSIFPSFNPSFVPSSQPSSKPSLAPSILPSMIPTFVPSTEPSMMPSIMPSSQPSSIPSFSPSYVPSSDPSSFPSFEPSPEKSSIPSSYPTSEPSLSLSSIPSFEPSSSSEPSISARLVLISEIQGANGNNGNGGDVSPLLGERVVVEAIVVGVFVGSEKLEGFFVQEEDTDADNDPRTSEGIFIFFPSPVDGVDINFINEGDKVSVTGRVSEFYTQTQITAVDKISILSSGNLLPTPARIDLKDGCYGVFSTSKGFIADLERFEGMLVRFETNSKMRVSEISNFDRFGELLLTHGEVPIEFSQVYFPSESGYNLYLQKIASLQVTLDDGSNSQNPDLADFPAFRGVFNTETAVRIGDYPNSDLIGCLGYSFGRYRMHPTGPFQFEREGQRPKIGGKAGKVGKEFRFAVTDVSNYFATLDNNGNQVGPNRDQDPRGAKSAQEFERQTEKLILSLLSLNSDVIGLVQVENDFHENSAGNAVKNLVERLNSISDESYDWVRPQQDGTLKTYVDESDAISNAFIYKSSSFSVAGVNILTDSNLPASFVGPIFNGVDSNRGTLAVTFQPIIDRHRRLGEDGGRPSDGRQLNLFDRNNECITVVLCHFKSKRSMTTSSGIRDGAGEYNSLQLKASQSIVEWLKGNPTGVDCPNIMITGNLNAYLKEDPIQYFLNNGYKSLMDEDEGTFMSKNGYWGSLDHQLYNEAVFVRVKDFENINFNSLESDALDYNLYTSRDPSWFDGSLPYRYSDHDPLVTEVDF